MFKVRYELLYYGSLSIFNMQFHKTTSFRSYGMYYCSDPLLVFSMTRASEVAAWNMT